MTITIDAARNTGEDFGGLFADLVADIPMRDGLPIIPAELVRYARSIRNDQLRGEAERVFIVWLRRKLGIEQRKLITTQNLAAPCAEPENLDVHFPEWPHPEDYSDDIEDPEFLLHDRRAAIEQARAKQICWEKCPVREICLNRSMRADAEYEVDRERSEQLFDGWSVTGGWGPGARHAIYNAVQKMQRDYRKDRMPSKARRRYEELAERGSAA